MLQAGTRCDTNVIKLRLLFVYFQVNTGVLYFLEYVEDIYIRVLSVLVSILNPNHFVFTPSTIYNNKGLSVPVPIVNPKSYVISTTNIVLILLSKI